MDEEPNDQSCEPTDNPGPKKRAVFKPSPMVDVRPCDNLHRYLVDKFPSLIKSKTVLFEHQGISSFVARAIIVQLHNKER